MIPKFFVDMNIQKVIMTGQEKLKLIIKNCKNNMKIP